MALLAVWLAAGMLFAELSPATVTPAAVRAADYDAQRHKFSLTVTRIHAERDVKGWHDASLHIRQLEGELTSVDQVTVQTGIRLTLESRDAAALPQATCGDHITAQAKLRLPQSFGTPGAWSLSDTLLQHGVTAIASVKPDEIVARNGGQPTLGCRLDTLRARVLDSLAAAAGNSQTGPEASRLTDNDTGVLAAALLGDRHLLTPETRTAFQRTGTYHLLIVSGLSVAVFAGFLYGLLRKLRLPSLPATVLTLLLLSGYAALTGFEMPVRRALLMTAIYMIGRLLYRHLEPLNSLAVAAMVLLIAQPGALFEAGFQMTFVAVLAIAGIALPILQPLRAALSAVQSTFRTPNDPGLPPRLAQLRVSMQMWGAELRPFLGRWLGRRIPVMLTAGALLLAELAVISLVLECALAPLMAVYFHRFTVISVAANVVTLLWLSVLLPLGVLVLLLALVSAKAAAWPVKALAIVLHIAQGSIGWLSRRHLSELRVPPARPLALMLIAAVFALLVFAGRRKFPFQTAGWAVLLAAVATLAFWAVPLRYSPGALEVTAIDVGQGDALLLLVPQPSGRPLALMVDSGGPAGPNGDPQAGERIGEDDVSNYLWTRGLRRLDAIALTHAHTDHVGGMSAVIRNFHPRELWVGANPPVRNYEELLAGAAAQGVQVRNLRAGDAFAFGDAAVTVLSPARDYLAGDTPQNEDSLVLRVDYAGRAALLEGDAQRLSEAKMVVRGLTHVDLLKVGHHGSLSSTTPGFLTAVSPDFAVISAGHDNLYGHPREPVLDRLEGEHTQTFRTDEEGTTTFLLDRRQITTSVFRAGH